MAMLASPHKPRSIYGLVCPISRAVVYIGCSCNPTKRKSLHYSEIMYGDLKRSPKGPWIKALDAMGGMRPDILILTENVPTSDAVAWERYWQLFYRLQHPGMLHHSLRDWNLIKAAHGAGHSINQIKANPWLAVPGGMPPSAKDGTARTPLNQPT